EQRTEQTADPGPGRAVQRGVRPDRGRRPERLPGGVPGRGPARRRAAGGQARAAPARGGL
ncbi:MAG: hypothetical protein AVDCRST_MAG53-498, partial [uncultured Solirubrobacteraceae bacterium]